MNFLINFKESKIPVILRVYLRDGSVKHKELELSKLLKPNISAPEIYFTGIINDYNFAIIKFIDGILLSSCLINEKCNVGEIMQEVGKIAAKISSYKFPCAGAFDKNLEIIPAKLPHDYLEFFNECIKDYRIQSILKLEKISKIELIFDKYKYLLPAGSENGLVHADFDPANILVNKIDGKWKVTGILDWEFAFAGSILHDIANMLRYAHQMPGEFKDGFIKGLYESGIILPDNWQTAIHLLNLIALLDCLKRTDFKLYVKRCADIIKLIDYIILELE